jgi:hypothetical protein
MAVTLVKEQEYTVQSGIYAGELVRYMYQYSALSEEGKSQVHYKFRRLAPTDIDFRAEYVDIPLEDL